MKCNGLYPSAYYALSENLTYISETECIHACLDSKH